MKLSQGNIICSEDKTKNFVEHESKFYSIVPLVDDTDIEGGKGGNSNVFKLIDHENDEEDYDIIKFCKYHLDTEDKNEKTRIDRFKNEIKALKKALLSDSVDVIEIKFNGFKEIEKKDFLYYVMEKGQMDMLEYFKVNRPSVQQKIVICLHLLNGISQLHKLDIYHRDIKPDNIFFINNIPKIGDLGLIEFREQDQTLDYKREKIGPSGWLSPEAVNKMLCEETIYESIHCCSIREYSDIFQLAKLVWYVFEGTAPIGQLDFNDFKFSNEEIFKKLIQMLQYSKDKRPVLENIIDTFNQQAIHYNA
jgi:serine/threonine protein kinase